MGVEDIHGRKFFIRINNSLGCAVGYLDTAISSPFVLQVVICFLMQLENFVELKFTTKFTENPRKCNDTWVLSRASWRIRSNTRSQRINRTYSETTQHILTKSRNVPATTILESFYFLGNSPKIRESAMTRGC